MKGQIAFEYMLMVLIALAFMMPVWAYITSVKVETTDHLALSYAKNAVDKIASTADLIYSQGAPAKVKVNIYIPDGTVGYNITNKTISLEVIYMGYPTPVYAESRAILNGTLPTVSGNYCIQIEAIEGEIYDVCLQAV